MLSLSNNHPMKLLKVTLLHNLKEIMIRGLVHQKMPPKKEVVNII